MRLRTRSWGDDGHPLVVAVHGVTGHAERFASIAEPLSGRFQVVAVDLRGHGRSGWEPPWNLEQHLADLLATAPEGASDWVGHSFGGRLVLELAARYPARVRRALLLDPALWVPPPVALEEAEAVCEDVAFASVEEAVAARLAAGLDHAPARRLIEADFEAHLARGADGLLRFRFSRAAVAAAYGEMARTPPMEPIERPLRIARAVESRVCPPELLEAYRDVAGELCSLAELPGGHTVMWDAAEATATAIVAFLASDAPGA